MNSIKIKENYFILNFMNYVMCRHTCFMASLDCYLTSFISVAKLGAFSSVTRSTSLFGKPRLGAL